MIYISEYKHSTLTHSCIKVLPRNSSSFLSHIFFPSSKVRQLSYFHSLLQLNGATFCCKYTRIFKNRTHNQKNKKSFTSLQISCKYLTIYFLSLFYSDSIYNSISQSIKIFNVCFNVSFIKFVSKRNELFQRFVWIFFLLIQRLFCSYALVSVYIGNESWFFCSLSNVNEEY